MRFAPLMGVLLAVSWAGPAPATGASVASLVVRPLRTTAVPGEDLRYRAIARMTDGTRRDVTAQAEWSTDDRALARFDPDDPGALRARKPGTVEITALWLARLGTARLVVDPGGIVGLVTRPSRKRLEIDRPQRFEARLVYESGYQEDVTEDVRWSSSDREVARVANGVGRAGRVVPGALGTTTIRARHPGGFRNTKADGATEILPTIKKVRFEEKTLVLGRGMKTELEVLGYHGDTGVFSRLSDNLVFSTDSEGIIDLVATGKDAGKVEALADGVALARVRDTLRKRSSGKQNPLVIVVAGVLEELDVMPNPFKVNAADSRNASVFGVLSSGKKTTENLRKLVEWLVLDPEIASVESGEEDGGRVDGLEPGTTTLMAAWDEFGVLSTAEKNLVVRGRVERLVMEPDEVVLGLDLPFALRAYAERSDETRSNVSGSVTWSVDPEGIVSVDDSGGLIALANGVATVTAVEPKTGYEANAEVTVAGRMTSLDVSIGKLKPDDEKKAKATGRLSSGLTTSDLRLVVAWSIDDRSIARVGNGEAPSEGEKRLDPGEVLGIAIGTTTLTAEEPITGLESTQRNNLTVRSPDDDDGGSNPGPAPIDPPRPTVVSVVVEPGADGGLVAGRTYTFKARSTRSDGSKRNISEKCHWTIDDPSIATVDNVLPKKGDVTGVSIGTTTVRVDCDGKTASAPVEVVGDVVRLEIQPDSFTGEVGRIKQFRALVYYSVGTFSDITRDVDWNSTAPDVASVSNEEVSRGRVELHEPGEALIYAVDVTGHVGTTTIVVE